MCILVLYHALYIKQCIIDNKHLVTVFFKTNVSRRTKYALLQIADPLQFTGQKYKIPGKNN